MEVLTLILLLLDLWTLTHTASYILELTHMRLMKICSYTYVWNSEDFIMCRRVVWTFTVSGCMVSGFRHDCIHMHSGHLREHISALAVGSDAWNDFHSHSPADGDGRRENLRGREKLRLRERTTPVNSWRETKMDRYTGSKAASWDRRKDFGTKTKSFYNVEGKVFVWCYYKMLFHYSKG